MQRFCARLSSMVLGVALVAHEASAATVGSPSKLVAPLALLQTRMEAVALGRALEPLSRADRTRLQGFAKQELASWSVAPLLKAYQAVALHSLAQERGLASSARYRLLNQALESLPSASVLTSFGWDSTRRSTWAHLIAKAWLEAGLADSQPVGPLLTKLSATLAAQPSLSPSDPAFVVPVAELARRNPKHLALQDYVRAHAQALAQAVETPPLSGHKSFWLELIQSHTERPAQVQPALLSKPFTFDPQQDVVEQWGRYRRHLETYPFAEDAYQAFRLFMETAISARPPKEQLQKVQASEAKSVRLAKAMADDLARLPPQLVRTYLTMSWRAGALAWALQAADAFLAQFRGHPDYPQVAYDRARLLEDKGEWLRAYKDYRLVQTLVQGTALEEMYWFRRAYVAHLARLQQARNEWQTYLAHYPEGKFSEPATFFEALLALDEAKTNGDAEALRGLAARVADFIANHPASYYSWRFAQIWDVDTRAIFAAKADPAQPPPAAAKGPSSLQQQLLAQRLEELTKLGLNDEGRACIRSLEKNMKGPEAPWQWLLGQAKAANWPDVFAPLALRIMREQPASKDEALWTQAFPLLFTEGLNKALPSTRSQLLTQELVLALVRQESAYNPKARSPVGALGLMQLMPSTASTTARSIGLKTFELLHAPDNLRLGTAHLAALLKRYEERLPAVLAAYNAGPKVTDQWLAARGQLDDDLFIEGIPFGETRTYVKLVLRNLWVYRNLLLTDNLAGS